jgi:hypothetical protein
MRRRPSKPKDLVTTATVRAPISAAREAMMGTRARAAAEAGGEEDHVRPFEALEDLVRVFQGGLAAHFRIGVGGVSEAARRTTTQ